MGWISEPEDGDSRLQVSSSKAEITNDNENPLANFRFDKLPTELLVGIFHHARIRGVSNARRTKHPYPVALSQVCRHWRNVALGAPTLWTDIRIVQYDTKEIGEAPHVYLERSKTCPIFLTWLSNPERPDIQEVINNLIIPGAERWQRITLITGNDEAADTLLIAMKSLDFPILQDVEISRTPLELSPSNPAFCHNAPLLRRCRFRGVPSFPPLPSSLVVLDYVPSALRFAEFDLDPLLEFLPHVAHSLEYLRFGLPPVPKVQFTPRTSKIPLEHLKSLLIKDSHVIMDHIFTPSLTYLGVFYLPEADTTDAAKMFEGFSAPILRSIQFRKVPLLPILTIHHFPSMFPQLESITLSGCTDESSFAHLLGQPKPKTPSSLQKASKYPFPNLKELTISDMTIWTSLQAAIEKRLNNGEKSLRRIRLPKEETTGGILSHLRRWLPTQGIELVLYERGELSMSTPEFQDDFCEEEANLFLEIMERFEWEGYDEDDDYEYWDERDMFPLDYDDYDYEEEEEDEADFYEG